MNTITIIKKYLDDNQFDGLINSVYECACSSDNLSPREDCEIQGCEPARYRECKGCKNTACGFQADCDTTGCYKKGLHLKKKSK